MKKAARRPLQIGRLLFFAVMICLLSACGSMTQPEDSQKEQTAVSVLMPEKLGMLTLTEKKDNQEAEQFAIGLYTDEDSHENYSLISCSDGNGYLVPENGTAAEDTASGTTGLTDADKSELMSAWETEGSGQTLVILNAPLQSAYLAASAAMDHFVSLGALDAIAFSGTDSKDWTIPEAREAMENGSILFAGKYSQPDYELLVSHHTDLAIESTMILHNPEVKEKLEETGIPVMTDLSSYEKTPLGRAEWLKVYGVLTDHTEEADSLFHDQAERIEKVANLKKTGKTVAFFYIDSAGRAVVRKGSDSVSAMIEMAGGSYVFSELQGLNPDSHSGSVPLSLEEFYASAKDADILIYNGTIDGKISSLSELTAKSSILSDFKAVRSGNVWCSNASMYQATDSTADIVESLHALISENEESEFFYRVSS